MTTTDLLILGVYIVGILVLGWAVSRRIVSFRDWFVAGGRMTTPLLVCTLVSTYYGLDVLFGGSEVGYVEGVVGWFYYLRPYYLAIIVAALLVARRLKRHDFLSLPDVAAHYYGRGTQVVVAGASFLYSLPLLAVMGLGILLDVVLGIPFAWGVLLGAAVSIAYTLMGGLIADALTDTVQFTLMCVTLGVAALLALDATGGVEGLQRALPASYFDPRGSYPGWVLLVFGLSALSVLVEPAFYQRIFAAVSYRAVLAALAIGLLLWASFDWVVTVLGMAAAAAGVQTEPRYALLTLVVGVLPAGLTGLFVAGVVATAMSTIDSYLLIAGGNLSYDLYRPLRRAPMTDAEQLRHTRWMVVVAGFVSVFFALFFQSMVSAWIFMTTVLIAAALVPILAALYLPVPPSARAGLWSSLGGLLSAVLFYAAVNLLGRPSAEWGTVIWVVSAGGVSVELWQEYAVLVALPVSGACFALGQGRGRRYPSLDREVRQ
ncbi:MAG TPA: sodium:solute symporter family protein [Longimicrobiales bacterium]|nr:sodium:solute symporter family protein [Longimicrobiales bacterium]